MKGKVKMRNDFEQYEALLNSVNEAANAYLEMEGGDFLLAWIGELIQDLTTKGYVQSAALTVQKLCDAVSIDVPWTAYEAVEKMEKVEKLEWLRLFAEVLMDRVRLAAE